MTVLAPHIGPDVDIDADVESIRILHEAIGQEFPISGDMIALAASTVEGRLFAKHDRIAGQAVAVFRCPCGIVSELLDGATTAERLDFDDDNLAHMDACAVHA